MKTLEQYLKNLSEHSLVGIVNENERLELLRFGLSAFNLLDAEKQVQICQTYSGIYRLI